MDEVPSAVIVGAFLAPPPPPIFFIIYMPKVARVNFDNI